MNDAKVSCPHCGQHLEVDGSLLGSTVQCPACGRSLTLPFAAEFQPPAAAGRRRLVVQHRDSSGPSAARAHTRYCPKCGGEIERSAHKCAHCGQYVHSVYREQARETRKSGGGASALVGGFVCLAMGLALLFVPLDMRIVAGLLFAAAMALGIVAVILKQVAGGATLLALCVVAPPLGFVGTAGRRIPAAEVSRRGPAAVRPAATSAAAANCRIEGAAGGIEGDRMVLRATLRNAGNMPVTGVVQVMVEWLDRGGRVIDSDWDYAMAGGSLAPGESRPFEISSRADPRMASFRCSVVR